MDVQLCDLQGRVISSWADAYGLYVKAVIEPWQQQFINELINGKQRKRHVALLMQARQLAVARVHGRAIDMKSSSPEDARVVEENAQRFELLLRSAHVRNDAALVVRPSALG